MTRVPGRPNKKRKIQLYEKSKQRIYSHTGCACDSLAVFGSLDFQTCRLTDSPKSAGREATLEVGLETWAATVSRRDLTQSLSLSFVASCHRRISLVKRETTDAYCASE